MDSRQSPDIPWSPDTPWTPIQIAAMQIYEKRYQMRRRNSLPVELQPPLSALLGDHVVGVPVPTGHPISSHEEVPAMRGAEDDLRPQEIYQSKRNRLEGHHLFPTSDTANVVKNEMPDSDGEFNFSPTAIMVVTTRDITDANAYKLTQKSL